MTMIGNGKPKTMTVCWVGWLPLSYVVGTCTGFLIGMTVGVLVAS